METLIEKKVAPEPGIYEGVDFETYFQWQAVNASKLKPLLVSALKLANKINCPDDETESLILGQCLHAAVGEPETMDRKFVRSEQCGAILASGKNKGTRCSSPGKMFQDGGWLCGTHGEFNTESRKILSTVAWDTMLNMQNAVERHPAAGMALRNSDARELSIVWRDERTKLLCKARIDLSCIKAFSAFYDFKTTRIEEPDKFFDEAFRLGYFMQMSHYMQGMAAVGLPANKCGIIAVNSAEPPRRADCVVYEFEDEDLEVGRAQLNLAMDKYAALPPEMSSWRGVSDDVVRMRAKPWMFYKVGLPVPENMCY